MDTGNVRNYTNTTCSVINSRNDEKLTCQLSPQPKGPHCPLLDVPNVKYSRQQSIFLQVIIAINNRCIVMTDRLIRETPFYFSNQKYCARLFVNPN